MDIEDKHPMLLSNTAQCSIAAYPSGEIDLAIALLKQICEKAKCLDDKLDASHLLIKILHHEQHDSQAALNICCDTLTALGENVKNSNQLSDLRVSVDR